MSEMRRPEAAATRKAVFLVRFSKVAFSNGSYGFWLRSLRAVGRSQSGTKERSGGRSLNMPLSNAWRDGEFETVAPLSKPKWIAPIAVRKPRMALALLPLLKTAMRKSPTCFTEARIGSTCSFLHQL